MFTSTRTGMPTSNNVYEELKSSITDGRMDKAKSIINGLRSLDVADDSDSKLLHLAIKKCDKYLVEFLINSGCDVNAKNDFGTTLLLASILRQQWDIAKFLLDANAKVDVVNVYGRSALGIVLNIKRNVPVDVVKCFYDSLKKNGVSSEEIGQIFLKAGYSLERAIHMHDPDVTRVMLRNSESYDDTKSYNAIAVAMETNSLQNVPVLLKYGIGVIDRKRKRASFLNKLYHSVIDGSNLEFAEPFIDMLMCSTFMDTSFVDFIGRLIMKSTKKPVEFLLDHKIVVHAKKVFKKDLFFHLFGNSNPGIVELLRSREIDLNVRDEHGESCLHIAVANNAKPIVQYLLDEGVDANITDTFCETPLYIACRHNNIELIELLLQYGADAQAVRASNGETIFDVDVRDGDNAFQHLLAHLALLEARDIPIDERIRDVISNRENLRNFYRCFRLQIGDMKVDKIFGAFTFFDALARRPENIAYCIRDKSVLSSILDCCEDKQWQSYYISEIKMNVYKVLEIIDLRKKAADFIYSCTDHLFSPDHLALEIIVSFLTYKDLRVFA